MNPLRYSALYIIPLSIIGTTWNLKLETWNLKLNQQNNKTTHHTIGTLSTQKAVKYFDRIGCVK